MPEPLSTVCSAIFWGLVVFVALQRLYEMKISRENAVKLLSQGGVEHAGWQTPLMVVLHVCWLMSVCAEVWFLKRSFDGVFFFVGTVGLAIGQYLRIKGRKNLGERWCVRVIVLPHAPLIHSGLYAYFPHPIYLGVALEIASLPLIHNAFLTAVLFSIFNGLLLMFRIHAEDKALRENEV